MEDTEGVVKVVELRGVALMVDLRDEGVSRQIRATRHGILCCQRPGQTLSAFHSTTLYMFVEGNVESDWAPSARQRSSSLDLVLHNLKLKKL